MKIVNIEKDYISYNQHCLPNHGDSKWYTPSGFDTRGNNIANTKYPILSEFIPMS